MSSGGKIGLGVGLGVGATVLLLVGFFFYRHRTKHAQAQRKPQFEDSTPEPMVPYVSNGELHSESMKVELDAAELHHGVYELRS